MFDEIFLAIMSEFIRLTMELLVAYGPRQSESKQPTVIINNYVDNTFYIHNHTHFSNKKKK